MALLKKATRHWLPLGRQIRFYSAPAERSIPPAKQKYVPTSGTYPKGFLAGSSHAGVKASNTKYNDIAMVVSETPCNATGVFTQNLFKAAPIKHAKDTLKKRRTSIRGVVVNSGCANAVTGTQGSRDAAAMAYATDRCFDRGASLEDTQTLVMSTGVIGQKLPIDKITSAIPKAHAVLGSTHEDWMRAAQAICTTDTFPKLLTRKYTLPSNPKVKYTLAGMTKGAGMIHPNMGTLLGIVCTDAKIDPDAMYTFLRYAADKSFNAISIDGDTSTNDSVVLLANGAAAPAGTEAVGALSREALDGGKRKRLQRERFTPDAVAFQDVLSSFMTDLAKLVVRDGEGATKFVTVTVRSDLSPTIARRVGTTIASSSLVKTALYGKDANWGRILCAIGYTPGISRSGRMQLQPEEGFYRIHGAVQQSRISVSFVPTDGSEPLKLFTRGEPEDVDEVRAKEILEMEDLEILVRLEDGPPESPLHVKRPSVHEEKFWTCDFSHEYVTINGDYRT